MRRAEALHRVEGILGGRFVRLPADYGRNPDGKLGGMKVWHAIIIALVIYRFAPTRAWRLSGIGALFLAILFGI